MNWYKKAQQHLMFYPWKDPRSAYSIEPPIYVDPVGRRFHTCHVCGKNVPEDQIADWFLGEGKKTEYFYPKNITKKEAEVILASLEKILVPYVKRFDLEVAKNPYIQYDWTLATPELPNKINSIPKMDKLCEFLQSKPYFSTFKNIICENEIKIDVLSYYSINNIKTALANIVSLLDYIKDFLDNPKSTTFSVPTKVPICKECGEKLDTCSFCEAKIMPNERSYKDNNDQSACQKCLENGTAGICHSCESLSENLNHDEDTGEDYCDSCYEELEKDYSAFEDEINEAAEKNTYPFKNWFEGKERIYIPYLVQETLADNDRNVIYYLKINGYTTDDINYRKGYCFKDGKRMLRIGKAIKDISRVESQKYKTPDEKKIVNDESVRMLRAFELSPSRKSKRIDNLKIVISQNAEDVAKMSTGRNWTSCMKLGKGQHYEDVFCEIAAGALIAYLIRKDDNNIENPLARILIRRYTNADGVSIALPDKIYGNASVDFYTNVKEWLDEKQKSLPKGSYERKGGEWVDSLPEYTYEKVSKSFLKLIRYARLNNIKIKEASYILLPKNKNIINIFKLG